MLLFTNSTMCRCVVALAFSLFCLSLNAQLVSHPSGYYAADSVFFTVNYTAPPGGKIKVAVNCFTDSCFKTYTGGFWLYNRHQQPNTWENQKLSKGSDFFNIDTTAPRGHLQKENVVRVRVVNNSNHVRSDDAYFIDLAGTGTTTKHTLPVVHLLVDSLAAFGPNGFYGPGVGFATPYGPIWNYDLDQSPLLENVIPRGRVEKEAIVEIIDTSGTSLLYQKCGIRVSGNSSRALPDKSMAIVARNGQGQYGLNRFFVDLGNGQEEYKWIRFRAGASAQLFGLGTHEIFERIIKGLNIGEVNVYPVIVYLNGSYWSIAFAQDKVQQYTVERLFGVDHDDVDLLRPVSMISYTDFLPAIQLKQIDTAKFIWTTLPGNNELQAIAMVDEGTKKNIKVPVERLFQTAMGNMPALSFSQLDSMIDVMSWLNYLVVAEYAQFELSHQVVVGYVPGKKLFLMRNEGDWFGLTSPATSYWQSYFNVPPPSNATFTDLVFRNVIMDNDSLVELYCLRAQDLYNTVFDTARTAGMVPGVANAVMPEYTQHWLSWLPNTGNNSIQQDSMYTSVKNYCEERTGYSWQHLADQWLPTHNYTLADREKISLVFDSIPGIYARVKLNTLYIDSNWSGLYFPNPAVRISVDSTDLPFYEELQWKEFPDSALAFSLNTHTPTTLTLILKRGSTSVDAIHSDIAVQLLPNPASDRVKVVSANAEIDLIKVTALDGREVLRTTKTEFSIEELPAGSYNCIIQAQQGIAIRKLVVLH